ncbi:hypothetical protein [Chromobacterium alticapitis]|uniref:Uncharacterized protein n=1 Tax=Chromobacterium alticapitis TaxID=2073169 RepID=A0A2S5DB54_9NEIS|nr:hypothetical protein [Chromobacterium alticapitis]POZ60264.1 hypothetical protein C2I19_19760 [Chromobacterium alticapitis]
MSKPDLRLLGAAAALGIIATAIACGPDFPMQMLDNRQGTLLGTPSNGFAFEAARLAAPKAERCDRPSKPEPTYEDLSRAQTDAANAAAELDGCAKGADCAAKLNDARLAYRRIRQLAACGAPDPSGAAASSLGDEALLSLRNAKTGQQCNHLSLMKQTECAAGIPPAGLKAAIALYAQEAAARKTGGSAVDSLKFIAGWALKKSERFLPLLDDAVSRRLLVAYALARVGDSVAGQDDSATAFISEWEPSAAQTLSGYADAARQDGRTTPNQNLLILIDAIQRQGYLDADHADRLAALAYRMGRYPLAERMAARLDSALASWVKAKLALRRGDLPAASRYYALAARGFPRSDNRLEPGLPQRISGEQAVLTLARGQYVEALSYLYQAAIEWSRRGNDWSHLAAVTDSSSDMAYVAERVLTAAELKTFVDALARPADEQALQVWTRLRYLLARRLLREGRADEASPYFPEDAVAADYDAGGLPTGKQAGLRKLALQYGEALRDTERAYTRTLRAKAWFRLAALTRHDGMALLGYEQEPDYADWGGNYQQTSGRSADAVPQAPLSAVGRAGYLLAGPYVTAEERTRFAATQSQPLQRYHYRYLAADYLDKAADLLPPRSQAYSAALCHGAAWLNSTDAQRAAHFYQRYARHGAYLNTGARFGEQCPPPQFLAAAFFPYPQRAARLLDRFGLANLLGLAALACFAGIAWRKRR